MWVRPAVRMMGDRCLRSVAAKLRTDVMELALGVMAAPGVGVFGVLASDWVVKRTRLFVGFIAPDAVTDDIMNFSRAIYRGAERSNKLAISIMIKQVLNLVIKISSYPKSIILIAYFLNYAMIAWVNSFDFSSSAVRQDYLILSYISKPYIDRSSSRN